MEEKRLGKYRHFKGKEYNVMAIAKHTEDMSVFVIYSSEDGKIWARPFDSFFGKVYVNGIETDRFTKID